jgi:hypothetical protein
VAGQVLGFTPADPTMDIDTRPTASVAVSSALEATEPPIGRQSSVTTYRLQYVTVTN